MKKKLIVLAVVVAVIVGLLAYLGKHCEYRCVYCRHSSRLECQGVE